MYVVCIPICMHVCMWCAYPCICMSMNVVCEPMCMLYTCLYMVCVPTCTHIYVVCILTSMHVYVCDVRIHVYAYLYYVVCVLTCMYVCMYILCIPMCMHVCMYVTCMHTHVYARLVCMLWKSHLHLLRLECKQTGIATQHCVSSGEFSALLAARQGLNLEKAIFEAERKSRSLEMV